MQVADSAEYIQGVTLISPETLTPCMIKDKTCFVHGIICDQFYKIENIVLKSGRFLSDEDLYGVFLGNRAAERLKLSVGDSFLIYSGLRDINLQVTAIGIFSSEDTALNDEVLIPIHAGQILSGNYPNYVTYIRVKYNESLISRVNLENKLTLQHDLTVTLNSNETDSPIEGGRIEVYGIKGNLLKSSYTDSLGEVTFRLDFGNYTIIAKYDSIQVNSSIFLETADEINLKISNPPLLYNLKVTVLDEIQNGIPHTTVIAWKGSEIIQMSQTNSSGIASFSLPEAIYQFSTLFWNHLTQESIEFQQTANPAISENLIFWYRTFKLGVRTNDPSTGLFLNSTVEIKFLNGTIFKSGVTGSIGYVEFYDISPTTYNISVKIGEIMDYQIIKMRSDRTVNFEILPHFNLQIQVYNDSNKMPINNSYITIYDPSRNTFESYTDENGISSLILKLDAYNITVQSGNFIKSRIIILDSNRNETFWMPPYNLTIDLKNITGHIQDNINVSLFSSALNDSQLTQNGLVTFFVPPSNYNISINCSCYFISEIYEISDPIAPLSFVIPPYNLTVHVFNGTNLETPPLSGITISIFESSTNQYISSALSILGKSSFLLYPNSYNVSVNVSNIIYYKNINLNQPYMNLVFYSYPYNLTIMVLNGSTSEPQSNIQIRIYDLANNLIAGPNLTDSSGYMTYLVNSAIYNITMNNSIYWLYKIKNIINPNTIYTFEFPPYNLTILVTNASTNLPLQNVLVEILSAENNLTLVSKNTSSGGIAQFNIGPGEYYINLTSGTYNFIQYREILADPQINFHIPPYKLTIQVIDYWEDPINNANVTINGGDPGKTNESGYIHFYLSPNIYNITVSYNNLTEVKQIDMSTYQESFQVIIKLTQKASLNVSVVNAISGRLLDGCSVKAFDFSGEFLDARLTDQSGLCQFLLALQVYNISVLGDGCNENQLINLTSDMAIIFSIIPAYTLEIFTFDDSDTYFTKNVLVQIYQLSGQLLFQDLTDNNGVCTFHLDYGTYNLSLQKGSEFKSELIDISQNEFRNFHMAPYKIMVYAMNSTGSQPISNELVTIYTLTGIKVISNYTNTLGYVEFLLNPGQYLIFLNVSTYYWSKQLDIRQITVSKQIVFSVSTSTPTNIDVADPTEYSASLLQQTVGLTESVVYILAIILTILVSFSIMNVVSSCVSESRKYIGVIRSIGASNRQAYYLINFRIVLIALFSGFLGGLIGIFLGSFISVVALEISLVQILTFKLSVYLILLAIGITFLIGMISSNLTLYRILKMPISSAIKEILPQTN